MGLQPDRRLARVTALRLGAAAALAVVLGAVVVWGIAGGVPYRGDLETDVRESVAVVGQFMAAGEEGDAAAAREAVAGLTADRSLSGEGIEELLTTRPELFEGYEAVDRGSYDIVLQTTWSGTRVRLHGEVSYADAAPTPFHAVLVRRNDVWRLEALTFGT